MNTFIFVEKNPDSGAPQIGASSGWDISPLGRFAPDFRVGRFAPESLRPGAENPDFIGIERATRHARVALVSHYVRYVWFGSACDPLVYYTTP